jgi:hypothetical protein
MSKFSEMVLIPKCEYDQLLASVRLKQSPDKIAEAQAEQQCNELLQSDSNEPDSVKLQKYNDELQKLLRAQRKRKIHSDESISNNNNNNDANMKAGSDWWDQVVKSVPVRYQCRARALCVKLQQCQPAEFRILSSGEIEIFGDKQHKSNVIDLVAYTVRDKARGSRPTAWLKFCNFLHKTNTPNACLARHAFSNAFDTCQELQVKGKEPTVGRGIWLSLPAKRISPMANSG